MHSHVRSGIMFSDPDKTLRQRKAVTEITYGRREERMEGASETFNLEATINAIGQALQAVVCHVFFDAALHGLAMAALVGLIGFVLYKNGKRPGKPLLNVCRKLSVFCFFVMLPGLFCLATMGKLPPVGVYNVNSIGFICFWALVCVHISAEEMEYWFFHRKDAQDASA